MVKLSSMFTIRKSSLLKKAKTQKARMSKS